MRLLLKVTAALGFGLPLVLGLVASRAVGAARSGPVTWGLTVAELPPICSVNRPYYVVDGADPSDCSTGGGSVVLVCWCTTSNPAVYTATGAADRLWVPTSASPPLSPIFGELYADTDTNELCFYDGSTWTGLKAGGACDPPFQNWEDSVGTDWTDSVGTVWRDSG